MEIKDMQRSPARVTVADDFSLRIPMGYRYAASGEIPRPRKELRERENTAPLLTLRSEDGAENWEFSVWDIKFHESADLQRYDKRVKMELLFIEPLLTGDKSREFELRHESDLCIYCELEDYDGDAENPDRAVYAFQIFTLKRVYHGTARFEGRRSRAENQERLGRVLGRIASRAEQEPPKYLEKFMALNEELPLAGECRSKRVFKARPRFSERNREIAEMLRKGSNAYGFVEYGMRELTGVAEPKYPFELSREAWELAEVFRVDSDRYDPEEDREAEIQQCLIREPDNLYVFLTFAWLLGAYKNAHQLQPAEIRELDLDTLLALAQLAGSRRVCYEDTMKNYYSTLCRHPDDFTAYLGEIGEEAVSGKRLPGEILRDNNCDWDEFEETRDDKKWCLRYLSSLRIDLKHLYPAMQKIAGYLRERRKDTAVPLRGYASDILYVWCSMAIAAARPFAFTSEVPMNYYYEEILTYDEFLACGGMTKMEDRAEPEEQEEEDEEDSEARSDLLRRLAQALAMTIQDSGTDDEDESYEETPGEHCARDTPALVCGDWVITIPAGFVYSTDPELIGNRVLVAGLDDGTLDLSEPFDSSLNLSVTAPSAAQNMPALPLNHPAMASMVMMARLMGENCLRDDNDMLITYTLGGVGSDGICHSGGSIVTRTGMYSFQLFDTRSKTDAQAEYTLRQLLGTIRTRAEYQARG